MKYGNDIIDDYEVEPSADNLKELISFYLSYTIKDENELEEWRKIVDLNFGKCYDGEETVARVLSLIRHKPYIHATMRGTCQSDWQGVYLPADEKELLPACESYYFNTGTEWIVYQNDEDYENNQSDFGIYVIDGDEQKKAIADACNVSPDEVKLIELGGYAQVPYWND